VGKKLENREFLKKETIRLYSEELLSMNQIVDRLGISQRQIFRYLEGKRRTIEEYRRIGSKIKNLDYFDSLDTQEKAYFLGLLYADGSVHSEKYSVKISLKESDKDLIEKLASVFNSNVKKRTVEKYKYFYTQVSSKYLVNSLNNLGLYPRKSYLKDTDILERVPNNLFSHFVRGVFDGDGGIHLTRKSKIYIATIADNNENFVYKLAEKIKNVCGFESLRIAKNSECNCRSIVISGNLKVKVFLDWIYKDATIFLKRKNDLYKDLVNLVNMKDFFGVRFIKSMKMFRGVVGYSGKRFYSPRFENEVQAAIWYDKLVSKLGYPKYRLNFPENYEKYLEE
jgi:hypothetical protein